MRMILMFDLPTETADDRKNYRRFRRYLLSEGFLMHQYSVYSKLLLNGTVKNLLLERLNKNLPPAGKISALTVTEKQFSKMVYLSGASDSSIANTDKRVVFLGDEL